MPSINLGVEQEYTNKLDANILISSIFSILIKDKNVFQNWPCYDGIYDLIELHLTTTKFCKHG